MNKKLQYVIALSCLLVAGSVAYYLSVYIPTQKSLAEQRECAKLAEARISKEEEVLLTESNAQMPETKYIYDSKSNQCVFWIKSTSKDTNETLVDLFTTKSIAWYTDTKEGVKYGDKDNFQMEYIHYFGK